MRELGGPGRGHILLVVAVALVMMAVRAAAGEPYGSGRNVMHWPMRGSEAPTRVSPHMGFVVRTPEISRHCVCM